MKTKLFSLLLLLLCLVGGVTSAWADDTYEYTNTPALNTDNYFTVAKGSGNANTFNVSINVTLANSTSSTVTKAVKMESGTTITFTSTRTATVYVGLYARYAVTDKKPSNNQFKFDSSVKTASNSTTDGSYEIVEISNVSAGNHTIERNGSEVEVYYVKVVEQGSSITKLTAPTISATDAGVVTIGSVANASKITYTTDGTTPTASSTTYTASFNVGDGTTVKAIAIGDGVSYSNSNVTTETIYIAGVTCAAPTFTVKNGTVAISTTTPLATIEYNTDGGSSYTDYTMPLTFFESTTVYARAKRESATTSSVSSQLVNNAPTAASGSKSIVLYYNTTDMTAADANPKGLTGNTGTAYEGWGITLANSSKTLSYGSSIDVDGSKTTLKGSNAVAMIVNMPSYATANRITLYSYNNNDLTSDSYWSSVGGTDYTTSTEVGLVSRSASTPDVRIFPLDNLTSSFQFNNNGAAQQCVVAVVDYTDSRTALSSFAFSGGTTTVTTSTTGSFSAPTLTTTAGGSPVDLSSYITYSSSNTSVATVNATTGAVSLTGAVGTATITASLYGHATYQDATASYTITVDLPTVSNQTWNVNDWTTQTVSTTPVVISNLQVVGTSSNNVVIQTRDAISHADFATSFTKQANMGSAGAVDGSHLTIKVKGGSKISVYAIRGSDQTKVAMFVNSTYKTESSALSSGVQKVEWTYEGSDDAIVYIYPTGAGAKFVAIKVAPTITSQGLKSSGAVKVDGSALTKDAESDGYSISSTTITLTANQVVSVAPTNIVLVNHVVYSDATEEDQEVDVEFAADAVDGYYVGTATIGATEYTVKVPYDEVPTLSLSASEGSISLNSYTPTGSVKVTVTGANLTGSTFTPPSVEGVTITPATATITDGAFEQEFTITSTASTAASTNIGFAHTGATTKTYTLSYSKTAQRSVSQTDVSTATTWDWSKAGTNTIELSANTSPTNAEEFLMAKLPEVNNDANFNSQALKIMTQFPTRGNNSYFQGNRIKFNTTVPGTLYVKFSNTGDSRPYRYLRVNGALTSYKSGSGTMVEADGIPVPAGEVVIDFYIPDANDPQSRSGDNVGTTMCRVNKIVFTPLASGDVVSVTDAAYATQVLYDDIDFTKTDDVTAYKAQVDGDKIKLVEVEQAPAGTPLVIAATKGTYVLEQAESTPADVENNDLVAATSVIKQSDAGSGNTIYVLNKKNDVVGFYKLSATGSLAKGKAYIETASVSAREMYVFLFDDEEVTTSIKATDVNRQANECYYNLNGQKVQHPSKGLYIVEGKKFFVK